MKSKYILGLNMYHGDSSACILKDGELIFAIEEERLNRIKHWAGFPLLSIKECLKFANISINDLSYISVNTNFYSNFFEKIKYALMNINNYNNLIKKVLLRKKKKNILKIFLKKNLTKR